MTPAAVSASVLAIDPGTTHSALVSYDPARRRVLGLSYVENAAALDLVRSRGRAASTREHLAVEMIACYGMPVGKEVFQTCLWIGRFIEAWGGPYTLVYRQAVKLHLCGSVRAKDPNVSQALKDKFGPGKDRAVGTKKAPGPLYGVTGDLWAALAVAVTWSEGGCR